MKFIMQSMQIINVDYIVKIKPRDQVIDIDRNMHRSRIYLSDGSFVDSPNTADYLLTLLNDDKESK